MTQRAISSLILLIALVESGCFGLGEKVPYTTTLSVLLAASIIGVLTPVPAGLGVLEAVYLALLSGAVPQSTLMGAVLAYRALYYVVPLGGALLLYLGLERYMTTHVPVETRPPKT